MRVDRSCGEGRGVLLFNGYRVSVSQDEKSYGDGVVMIAQHYECM